ncbi:MAG: hypothetical protein CM1200mP5_2630 [Candidatus Pelagibacterales bacterium]|nr:MAG: hypothetical protein CM1200mP5_2630 [Pelagibacterales bacterium]
MCFAFTNEIPKNVKELDLLSKELFYKAQLEIKKLVKLKSHIRLVKKKGGW